MFYLDRIMEAKTMERILDTLEMGLPLQKLVQGIVRTGVSEGIHTIDAGILVAPAIAEAIKGVADDLDIEYDEGLEDKEADAEDKKLRERLKRKARLRKLSKEGLSELREEMSDGPEGMEDPMEDAMEMEDSMEAPMPMQKGLMAREDI
jgi:flavin-dependent dehydrogenase